MFERASSELEERGAGIGLLEATHRYPVHRGIDLRRISVETDYIRYFNRDGSVLLNKPHSYRFSSWNTVYRSLLGCFDRERYQLGHELINFSQDDNAVNATFTNGASFEGDLLVAADGIGSIVRSRLEPSAGISYAGYVAWRGVVQRTALPPEIAAQLGDAVSYFVFANSHILVYPIPSADGSVDPDDQLMNFVRYRNYLEGGDLDDLLTDRNGERRDLSVPPGSVQLHHVDEMRATAKARLPAILESVVGAVPDPFLQIIYDIAVERMAFGRICLLGDAAFAVRPHAAAGTAKAADDAWMLAAALDGAEDVPAALQRWEPTQLQLGRHLADRSTRVGARSQVNNEWDHTDDETIFGLHYPGD